MCFDCLQPFHHGLRCDELRDSLLEEWKRGRDAGRCPRCRAHLDEGLLSLFLPHSRLYGESL